MRNGSAVRVCTVCRFGSHCIYEAASRQPILQCGQFELALPAGAGARIRRSLAGLCSNCDLRDDCIYPKPEGGVWRCEEYR